MAKRHKDLEFEVSDSADHRIGTYKTASEAAIVAISRSMARGGEPVFIDVLTWTRAGARAYMGESGVEVYDEDPDASIHDRIVVTAQSQGRIS